MNVRCGTPLVASLLLLGACASAQQPEDRLETWRSSRTPARLEDGWAVAAPGAVGVDPVALDTLTARIRAGGPFRNVHALLIVKNDRLVYEEYFAGVDRRWVGRERETVSLTFDRDTLHDTRSITKSITAAVLGIAVAEGAIASVESPLAEHFPELAESLTAGKRQITIRHALTMSAGLSWNEAELPYTDPRNDAMRMHTSDAPGAVVLGRELVDEPGERMYYNSGLPVLLGLAVGRATGRSFGEYAREKLFEPLGIETIEWAAPPAWSELPELTWAGSEPWATGANPGNGLWVRPRDLAKFGSLYLNGGAWNGRQILPAAWVGESTDRHIEDLGFEMEPPWEMFSGYGYFWYHDRLRTKAGDLVVHTAPGNGQQRIFVIPDLDLLVVHLAGRYGDPEATGMARQLLTRHILPAVMPADSR